MTRRNTWAPAGAASLLALLLLGCSGSDSPSATATSPASGTGGNGSNGAIAADGTSTTATVAGLLRVARESAGPACPQGGYRFTAWQDSNGNGQPDAGEPATEGTVCDGAAGSGGARSLVRTESAGSACAAGGTRLVAGPDANGDGTLQDSEATTSAVVCNGTPGTPAGAPPLLALGALPAGGVCPAGGTLVQAGLDANANGLLDAAEVASSSSVCSGGGGAASLVSLADEAPGATCPAGGTRIQSGSDANANGVLDAPEVAATRSVCNGSAGAAGLPGATGADGLVTLVSASAEPAGSGCASGGTRLASGVDANRNGTLDAGEVSSTRLVCNGGTGATGSASLVHLAAEPAGTACPGGGLRVASGSDANANGVLDGSEVASTAFACNGSAGAAGAAGASGAVSRVAVSTEPAGTACPTGGSRIDAGLDSNANGQLDTAEITSTSRVCNGATGSIGSTGGDGRTSLVSVTGENPGTACAAGGTRVRTGIDSNGNGVLEDAEVSASAAVCNGSAGVGLGWTALSAGPVQALANQGYVADSGSEIVLTLPANPATGDLVRVTGAGGGGWRVAQGSGQWVDATPVGAQALQEGALGASLAALDPKTMATVNGAPVVTTAGQCLDVAGSASGRRLALAFSALLYIGGDDGASWINVSPGQPSAVWPGTHSNLSHSTVAVSADGRYLISASGGNRRLQFSGVELRAAISDNGGLTWRDTAHAAAWSAAAMSANGSRIVLAEAGVGQGVTSVPGRLWISSDHGLTWAASGPALKWRRVKMSADGLRIVAVAADIDLGQFSVHTSSDGGQTWTSRLEGGQPFWMDAGISADGQRMVAMATDNGITNPGALRISDDGGQTWRDGPGGALRSVAVSADGRTVAALEYLGTGSTQLQLSSDGGRTWGSKSANVPLAASGIASDPTRVWLNADGSVLYFCGPPAGGAERIYRSTVPGWAPASTTGSAGSLAGGRHSAVDLQYTGNGRWLVVGHLGTLWVR